MHIGWFLIVVLIEENVKVFQIDTHVLGVLSQHIVQRELFSLHIIGQHVIFFIIR